MTIDKRRKVVIEEASYSDSQPPDGVGERDKVVLETIDDDVLITFPDWANADEDAPMVRVSLDDLTRAISYLAHERQSA